MPDVNVPTYDDGNAEQNPFHARTALRGANGIAPGGKARSGSNRFSAHQKKGRKHGIVYERDIKVWRPG